MQSTVERSGWLWLLLIVGLIAGTPATATAGFVFMIGVDVGFDGRVLGIEILDAREQLGLAQGRLDVSLEQAVIAAGVDRRG
jgi:uncharacterized protein YuzE